MRVTRLGSGRGRRLNWQLIVPVVAGTLLAVGAGLLACAAVALIRGGGGAVAFGTTALVVIPLALAGVWSAPRLRAMPLVARDGFFAVTVSWLAAAIVGAIPLLLTGTLERPLDAFFESMSGFTTTGATLLTSVESEADAVLLWRSMSQWIGGVGIVVLVVAIAPAAGLASQRVFYAETSGVTAERLTPRIADTAKIIWAVYLTLTVVGFLAYWIAGMPAWDAVNHTLTTVATGGFSTRTASLAAFDSLAIELVAMVFMAAGGVNFAFYYRALKGGSLWPQAAEVRLYLLLLVGSILAVSTSLTVSGSPGGFWQDLREGAFSVTSVMTTTGYTTVDFDGFNDYARSMLLLVMFFGGCAGSTAGGIKIIRVLLLAKTSGQEIQRQLQPRRVLVLRTRGRVFSEEVRRGALGFLFIYVLITAIGTLAMTASGLDTVSAFSSVAATLNVVGPGLGEVGAVDNYEAVSDGGRLTLTVLMLIGRLEIFTVLVLLTPAFWRRGIG